MYTWQSNWVLAISTASFHVQITSLSVISTVLLRQTLFKDVRYGGRGVVGIALCLVGAFLWLRDETIDSRQQEMSIGSVLLTGGFACLRCCIPVRAERRRRRILCQESELRPGGVPRDAGSLRILIELWSPSPNHGKYDQLSEMIAKAKVVPWNELIVAILLDFLLAFPAFSTVFTTSYSTFYPNSKPQF